MKHRKEVIGDATLYLGDCLEVMAEMEPGTVDSVVTDPPYGMGWDGKISRGPNGTGSQNPTRHYGKMIQGDEKPFDPSPFLEFNNVVLWGANHYSGKLPTGTTLLWIKRVDSAFGSFLSDAEVAWMKGGHGVYCQRDVSLQGESKSRKHPNQKPIGIMAWCIEKTGGETILDPFMGSGTTGVACMNLSRKFIGIEVEEKYFDIACRRIDLAARQQKLFPEE